MLENAVILRPSEHPHTRNIRKSDPVARYQQFRQSWTQQRAPGEKKHNQLRWNIREQMLAQDQVVEKVSSDDFFTLYYTQMKWILFLKKPIGLTM